MNRLGTAERGFTLIELSIVLVIIGLIIGSILVGQDLIKSAEARAQISQLEKYNTAANTFVSKYGALPGDMKLVDANRLGFNTYGCQGIKGERDGNGILDGDATYTLFEGFNEVELFWQDLSSIKLIDVTIPNGGGTVVCDDSTPVNSETLMGKFLPEAKIGRGNYIYAYEVGGINWFGISAVTGLGNNMASGYSILVEQAYSIDKKVDDGLPTTGNVQAIYVLNPWTFSTNASPNAVSSSATTCYKTTGPAYSIDFKKGTGPNCALSFRFQ